MDIKVIIKIDELINRGATGSPYNLACKLNMSDRTVYSYIKFMKEELNAPITFSRALNTYQYKNVGGFQFKWMNKN